MTGIDLVGMIVAVGLLGYLIVALLKPEWFA
jgi:K+-transporting ATPase KdpF subunit